MAKFLMLGKYSQEAIQGISPERTKKVAALIEKSGGRINSMFVLLGAYDVAFVIDLPGIQEVMKTSIEIMKATGISFITLPAISVDEFDRMMGSA
jgi:uncharacterized protein with GYD domain